MSAADGLTIYLCDTRRQDKRMGRVVVLFVSVTVLWSQNASRNVVVETSPSPSSKFEFLSSRYPYSLAYRYHLDLLRRSTSGSGLLTSSATGRQTMTTLLTKRVHRRQPSINAPQILEPSFFSPSQSDNDVSLVLRTHGRIFIASLSSGRSCYCGTRDVLCKPRRGSAVVGGQGERW